MQYILTEEEFKELVSAKKNQITMTPGKLQKLCTRIADELPISFWHRKEKHPWGCKITKEKEATKNDESFCDDDYCCDECIVSEICPYVSKAWSK